jgi:hypothetical protein
MKPVMKLSSIDQEHLQELYDAAGIARDELPYTPAYETLVQGFQDRTFKNADPEMVFSAILKYVRTGGNPATEQVPTSLNEDQLKQLKIVLSRHMVGGKILPYSDEFNSARTEFNRLAGMELTEHEFWRSMMKSSGAKRRPPVRKKPVAAAAEESDDDE